MSPHDGNATAHPFDKEYWEQHWGDTQSAHLGEDSARNPYLVRETSNLVPGTALDAGCGTGEEAIWLASRGWRVVAADISATALERAAARAVEASVSDSVTWVEADLTTWEPDHRFDLVMTNYAHPAMPQLAFYERIADWVVPGGTLLIVGHLHEPDPSGHELKHDAAAPVHPPAEATATVAGITGVLDAASWRIDSGKELTRTVPSGSTARLHDVVVRATRLR